MAVTGDFSALSRAGRRLLATGAALLLALTAGAASAQSAALPAPIMREGVAAVVNDEIISTYDLRQRVLLLIVTSGVQVNDQNLQEIQGEALRDLIDEALQMQEVRRIESRSKVPLQPTAQEITEQVERLAQQNGMTGKQLVESLATAGVDQRALAAQLMAEIAWQRYVGGRFGGSIKVGDDQIAAAVKRAEQAQSKTQYQVAEIFIDAQRAGGEAAATQAIQSLATQIAQGAPFNAVARQFSNAPSAASGGDAGWMVSGDMAPQLERALEQLRPGQLSGPVAINGGVYLLFLRDKRSGTAATLVNLKQAAVRLAADAPAPDVQAAQTKLEALRPRITSCAAMDTEGPKVEGVVVGDLGEADLNDLSASFRDAINGLQVGQVSTPVRTGAGLHLVALCGRRSGGPNQVTRDDVENRLTEQELVMISRRELRNLRNSASIDNR